MQRVITYSLSDDFIDNLSSFIIGNFSNSNNDFSSIACVFGGRRPALFLRRSLACKIKKPFFPPCVFSMDDFAESIVSRKRIVKKVSDLDACYLIYSIAKKVDSSILRGRDSFSKFLPWAKEIASFIDQMDEEDISNDSLMGIQKSADIGYDIPESINTLLQNIISIRSQYHSVLDENQLLSRGLLYLYASRLVEKEEFKELKNIIFCNMFYLHSTEIKVMKAVYAKGKGIFIFQGDKNEWPILKKDEEDLAVPLNPEKRSDSSPEISIYAGCDLHTQAGIVRGIIEEQVDDINNTVIILPRGDTLIPLLSQIDTLDDFNVSMGYPLKRTPVFTLFSILLDAQKSRKESNYYAPDYLKVLRHPLIKNLDINGNPSVTRVIVHKLEEVLKGRVDTDIGGALFIKLDDIENLEELYIFARDTLRNMDINTGIDELKDILKELHNLFFYSLEGINNFKKLCASISDIAYAISEKSMLNSFPFNRTAMRVVFSLIDELSCLCFLEEEFPSKEIFSIFLQRLEGELVSFSGSPLSGLQILGLLEARSLNFKNVIFLDTNESALPKLRVYEPLIPREIMLKLGINKLEKEEEIQKYQFMRLIASSKKAFLVYEENKDKERSRFVEELIWKRQKETGRIDAFNISRGAFSLKIVPHTGNVKKTSSMITYLKERTYSSTMLNTYLRCPLQFYYHYVLGLGESTDLLDDLKANEIGSFLHKLLEDAFTPFINKRPVIDKAFRVSFKRIFEDKFSSIIEKRMKSDSFLLKRIIENRMNRFLDEENKRAVDKVMCLEREFSDTMNFNGNDYEFISKVDRIDEINDSLVIIDYKSGGSDVVPRKIIKQDNLKLSRDFIKDNIKSFQLPLYYLTAQNYFPGREIEAQIYNLRTLERKSLPVNTGEDLKIYTNAIGYIIQEILNPDVQFFADREDRKCKFCSFFYLCR